MKLKLLASAVFGVALSLSGVAEANSNFSTNLYLGHSTGFTDTVSKSHFVGCPVGSTYYGPADCINSPVLAGYSVRPISALAASKGLSLTVNCTALDAVCADTFATAIGGITTNNVTLATAMAISGSTTVKTWYCQNSDGTHCANDATQSTIAKRPTFAENCTLLHSQACAIYNTASNQEYASTNTVTLAGAPYSIITYAIGTVSQSFSSSMGGIDDSAFFKFSNTASSINMQCASSKSVAITTTQFNSFAVVCGTVVASGVGAGLNGTLTTSSSTNLAISAKPLCIGAHGTTCTTDGMQGFESEILFWNIAPTAAQLLSVAVNENGFF